MYVVLDKENPCMGSLGGLNLAAVRPTTDQRTNCSFEVITYVKAQPAAQAFIGRNPLYTLYKCYLV
jgi:hypothetical protein